MVGVICGRENLGLVDVVDIDCLQNLRLGEVSDAAFCHDGNTHRLLDTTDHRRIAHARHTTSGSDVSRNPLKCHYRTRTSLFRDARLFRRCHIHDYAAFEHLRELSIKNLTLCLIKGAIYVIGCSRWRRCPCCCLCCFHRLPFCVLHRL